MGVLSHGNMLNLTLPVDFERFIIEIIGQKYAIECNLQCYHNDFCAFVQFELLLLLSLPINIV